MLNTRTLRRWRIFPVVIACMAVLSGCGVSVGTSSGGSTRNEAFEGLRTQIDHYLAIPQSEFTADPEQFFADGAKRLRKVRTAQARWLDAVDVADLPNKPSGGNPSRAAVEEFDDALDGWIAAQEEQFTASKHCWASVDRASCYREMFASNGAKWNATGVRVNAAIKTVSTEANR
jgi:hypothetical protein